MVVVLAAEEEVEYFEDPDDNEPHGHFLLLRHELRPRYEWEDYPDEESIEWSWRYVAPAS